MFVLSLILFVALILVALGVKAVLRGGSVEPVLILLALVMMSQLRAATAPLLFDPPGASPTHASRPPTPPSGPSSNPSPTRSTAP